MVARQTVERRQLGLSMKRHRQAQGRSQLEVANVLGTVDSRISKLEDGTATLDQQQLTTVLDFLDVHGAERDAVLELGLLARKRQRHATTEIQAYTDTLPGSFQRIADMESDATEMYCWEPSVIPWPLQAPGYIRAMMRAGDGIFWDPSDIEIENRIAFRRGRQIKVLEASVPKKLEFVFAHGALVGDDDERAIMRGQLEHLLYLAKQYPNIRMGTIEAGISKNPSRVGAIIVLDFSDSAPRVAFAPAAYGPSTYFDQDDDTVSLLRAFRRIQELADSHDETIEIIRRKLREN